MKLSRLLATLALIVAGGAAALTGSGPAAAGVEPEPTRTISPETLRGICTLFDGTYVEGRTTYSCEISDGTIACGEGCHYEFRLDTRPPLMQSCESVRGTFAERFNRVYACLLDDGILGVFCPPDDPAGPERVMLCGIGWIPSEQPMS